MKTKLSSLRQFLSFTSLLIFFSPLTAQIFWTEDFDQGLPESWTALEVQGDGTESANWIHTTLGPISLPPIESSSAMNGWMLFDSDANCSGVQEVRLISPRINCETKANVFLQFETLYRRFNDIIFLEWSTDSIEWTEINLFPNVTNSQYGDGSFDLEANPQKVVLDLSDVAAGEDSLFLSFKFLADKTTLLATPPTPQGCGFSWQIDDIQLSTTNPKPKHDLRVNSFYAIAPNAMTPKDQHMRFGFLADIQNIGQETQTGVKLSIQIKDGANQVVYADTLDYNTVIADTTIENKLFLDDGFLPDDNVANYAGTYEIFADSVDLNPSNNTKTFNFISSDSTFAKENGISFQVRPDDASWPPNQPHSWIYGNYFFIPNGADKYATKVSFGLGNPTELKDQLIQIKLYKWEDSNGDNVCNNSERIGIATRNYFVTGNEGVNQFFTVSLLDDLGTQIPLEDNTGYLVMIEYTPFSLNRNMELSVSSAFDYGGYWQRTIDTNQPPGFTSFIGFGSTFDFFSPGFGYDIIPAIRLHISNAPAVSTEELLAEKHQIQLGPNPATDYLKLNIKLENQFERLDYVIVNELGQAIEQKRLRNIQEKSLQLDVSDWAKGIYFIQFFSDEGNRTMKFVLQ